MGQIRSLLPSTSTTARRPLRHDDAAAAAAEVPFSSAIFSLTQTSCKTSRRLVFSLFVWQTLDTVLHYACAYERRAYAYNIGTRLCCIITINNNIPRRSRAGPFSRPRRGRTHRPIRRRDSWRRVRFANNVRSPRTLYIAAGQRRTGDVRVPGNSMPANFPEKSPRIFPSREIYRKYHDFLKSCTYV